MRICKSVYLSVYVLLYIWYLDLRDIVDVVVVVVVVTRNPGTSGLPGRRTESSSRNGPAKRRIGTVLTPQTLPSARK